MRKLLTVAACLLALLSSARADASLTDSEKGQIRSWIEHPSPEAASRLRALVARPDLTADESSEALGAALRDQPFVPARETLLGSLLFGPASRSSRASLVSPVSRALLTRAHAVMQRERSSPAAFVADPAALEELLRIHRFIGKAVGPESGVGATLRNDATRAVAVAYRDHVQAHAGVLGFLSDAEGPALLLRTQVASNVAGLASVLDNRDEAAGWLGLTGSARGLFVRTGVVIASSQPGQELRIAQIARVLESVPAGLRAVRVALVDKTQHASLGPSAAVLPVRARLGAVAPVRDGLWPAELRDELPDQALVEAAWAVSLSASRAAMASNPSLARAAESALRRAAGKGDATFIAPWLLHASLDRDAATSTQPFPPEFLAASAATMLLTDGRRVVDLAMSKWLAGRGEPLEQVLLGLALLAVGNDGSADEQSVRLGQDGGRSPLPAGVTLRDGRVVRFVIDGHRYEPAVDAQGGLSDVRFNGEPASSVAISAASVPVTAGDRWGTKDRELIRCSGAPRIAVLDDGRTIVASAVGSSGVLDTVVSRAPSSDQEIQAHVRVIGSGGGLVVRAKPSRGGFDGAALLLECAAECTARLVQVEAGGTRTPLGEARVVGPQPPMGFSLRLSVEGDNLRASIGSTELASPLARPLQPGHAGFTVSSDTRLEVRAWRIDRAGRTQPAKPTR